MSKGGTWPNTHAAPQRKLRASESDLVAACDMGAYEIQVCSGPTFYESADPASIVLPANAIGSVPISPFEHAAPVATLLYYAAADGSGFPRLIRLIKAPPGIQLHF